MSECGGFGGRFKLSSLGKEPHAECVAGWRGGGERRSLWRRRVAILGPPPASSNIQGNRARTRGHWEPSKGDPESWEEDLHQRAHTLPGPNLAWAWGEAVPVSPLKGPQRSGPVLSGPPRLGHPNSQSSQPHIPEPSSQPQFPGPPAEHGIYTPKSFWPLPQPPRPLSRGTSILPSHQP